MEFNIALHTIFYISTFVIPGILLRRFYFSGEFNKEFSQGNLMERFIWTILSSIVVLLISSLFFYLIRLVYDDNLLSAISYKTIKEIFELLSENILPDSSRFFAIYKDFLILIIGIYTAAIIIGSVAKRMSLDNKFSSIFPVFRFNNYWYYFVRGRVKSAPKEKGKKYWYTLADVLVQYDDKSKMYSGKISDYYISPTTNQLENIFLEDAERYKFNKEGGYDLVPIPGHTFCIPFTRVLNLNLTYVNKESNGSNKRSLIHFFIDLMYYLVLVVLVSFLFLKDIPYIKFNSFIYKLSFCLNSWVFTFWIKKVLQKWVFLAVSESEEDWLSSYIIGFAITCIQYLWILNCFPFWNVIGFSFIIFLILTYLLIKTDKQ